MDVLEEDLEQLRALILQLQTTPDDAQLLHSAETGKLDINCEIKCYVCW